MGTTPEGQTGQGVPGEPAEGQESWGGMPGDGAGRVEEAGRSGVYPVSASEGASGDARIQGEASWGQGERGAAGYEDHGTSETMAFPPEGADGPAGAPGAGS